MEHSVEALAAQRMHTIALGCEDLRAQAALCSDGALPLLVGQSDPPGEQWVRDRGQAWATRARCTGWS